MLAINAPSPTTLNPTSRTFIKNSAVKGLANSNYYSTSYCTVTTLASNQVKVVGVSNSGYGYGYVLPDIVKGGSNLTLSATRSDAANTGVSISYYASDGTFLSYAAFMKKGDGVTTKEDTVAVPENAEYVIVLFIPATTSTAGYTFTLNSISVS